MARRVAKAAPRFTLLGLVAGLVATTAALSGCGKPEELSCAPHCRQNTLMTCDVDGDPIETPCGATRCAADSPVPQCVPVDALPCDADQIGVLACLNGRALNCDGEALYQLVQSCPEGELCDSNPLGCRPVGDIGCLVGTWLDLCLDDVEYTCEAGRNRVLATPKRCPAE